MSEPASATSEYPPLVRRTMERMPAFVTGAPDTYPSAWLCLRTAALLALFVLVDQFMLRAARLPAASYEQPYLIPELAKRIGPLLSAAILVIAIVLARYGRLLSPWRALGLGGQVRWFVVFLALVLAWPLSTYGYNYYFDQGHYLERALIVLLVPLIYLRPVFIYPFLLIGFALMWQLAEPPLGFGAIFAHKLQLLHVLTLFGAVFFVHALTGSRRTDGFFFLTCCIVASAYWEPALAKLELDWITFGHLYRMPLAAYAHGWLAFLDPETIVEYSRAISWFDWPMRIFVLTIEAGSLLFLVRRSVSIALLATVIVFHLGVFALYGYLFWTWILLDAALLIILARDWRAQRIAIYSREHLLLSVIVIGFGSIWFAPSHLGWLDTRLSYTYRYEAVGQSGARYTLPPRFFEPYGDVFTMGNFTFLIEDHGVLVGPYGITRSRERADRLEEVLAAQQVFALESEVGPDRYSAERAAGFYRFITRYVANRNARGEQAAFLRALEPPPQFWSFGRGEVYRGQEPIREVIVTSVTTLFDDRRLEVIRAREIARLEIPASTAP